MAELECPSVMSKLIAYLSSLLQQVAESNDLNPRFYPQKISAFHGLTRPTISIQSYLERIFKYYNNAYYAKVGGISTTEINFLEVDFLFGLGFQLNVNPTTFHTYCSYLQKEMFLLQPPLNTQDPSSSSSSTTYKSRSTKLLHYEDDQQQEVVAV